MEKPHLTSPELVLIDLSAEDKHDATAQLAALLHAHGRISDLEGFLAKVAAREHQMATGLPGGVGVPHARTAYSDQASVAVGVTAYGKAVDFGASDGPASIVILIAAPLEGPAIHLEVVASLARKLVNDAFREKLRRSRDPQEIAAMINEVTLFDH